MIEKPLSKKGVTVLGRRIAYHERGEGSPILFLHGNPTSSYLWRNVIPALEGHGRLIAPDLIGMGDSEKLPDPGPETYTFKAHRDFLWAFVDAVVGDHETVVLVIHDWGSALGFDWANHHRDRVRAIAYMEGFVQPIAQWSDWNEERRPMFQALRSERGEELILEQNIFIEKALPGSVIRPLSNAEDARISAAFPQQIASMAHTYVAAPDPHRGNAGRRSWHRRRLRKMDVRKSTAKIVHQCRARTHFVRLSA